MQRYHSDQTPVKNDHASGHFDMFQLPAALFTPIGHLLHENGRLRTTIYLQMFLQAAFLSPTRLCLLDIFSS